ncbi:MAG: glycosidase, partial [Gammaproteobacteria bacterium]|nr:glycosidase [Gammaproteobacteria bacterium]
MRIKEQRTQLVRRRPTLLNAESSRVITRLHIPGDKARSKALLARVAKLSEDDVQHLLEAVYQDFSARHRNFRDTLQRNFERIAEIVPDCDSLSGERRLLLGAYMTAEYSVESAALFNPSIVPHPDQKGVPKGSRRFVMSFRATGEGHISSIEFRSGVIDENLDIYIDAVSQYVATPEIHTDPTYDRRHFRRKLEDIGASHRVVERLLEGLSETFTFDELEIEIEKFRSTRFRVKDKRNAIDMVLWLARSNYEVIFDSDQQISERVIFPVTENERAGIEDARFVRFVDDDQSVNYYATYTAYNGFAILPQLLETTDFLTFKMHTLNGHALVLRGIGNVWLDMERRTLCRSK